MNKEYVSNVTIRLTIDGRPYGVDTAKLRTAINSIPEITLSVWPLEAEGETKVWAPSIIEYAQMYKELSDKAETLDTLCDIDIRVIVPDLSDSQFIWLEGWILAGAGMSQVSSVSAPYLTVVIQHPICRLTKCGFIYETPNSEFYKTIAPDTSRFTAIADYVYDRYANAEASRFLDTADYSESGSTAAEYRKKLGEQKFKIGTYLNEKTNTLFLQKYISSVEALRRSVADLAKPSSGGIASSSWDMLLRAAGTLLMWVSQDKDNNYTKQKLVLEPVRPWLKPTMDFVEDECSWVELPGMDPFKLAGVQVDMSSQGEIPVTHGLMQSKDAKARKQIRYAFYAAENPDTSVGRIVRVSRPICLEGMNSYDAAYQSEKIGNTTKDEGRPDGRPEKQYAYAVYYTLARSMVRTHAEFRLMFERNGALIVPGLNCTFKSKGEVVYYGNISEVVHELSTSGRCQTNIGFSYVRSEEDYPGITIGTDNPAYT
jgi:hypothetical protein